ncbi:MAG: hypothetical protein HC869_02575 [Rhodospirillales bacterium]|nr:hypothetical protein [Rhodospirillales bacterium]
MAVEMLEARKEGAVLFAQIAAQPMNLIGSVLVHVLSFKNADPNYFISQVRRHQHRGREAAAKLTGEASLGLLFRYLGIKSTQGESDKEPFDSSK